MYANTRKHMSERKPIIAITMGDATGIGPEIVAKAWANPAVRAACRVIVIGDLATMDRVFSIIGAAGRTCSVTQVSEACFEPGALDILDLKNIDLKTSAFGQVMPAAGKAAYEYIIRAIELAIAGKVDAVVTSPIHKRALHLAGYQFDGHTEILAKFTGAKEVAMMLVAGDFRVTHVSTHCSLRQAINRCKRERILSVIRLTHDGVRQIGIPKPRIAVSGLNPHAGEGGLFGKEEIEEIQPAIDAARAEGINVYGSPLPPDTVFYRMLRNKEFNVVVAQYHDQGHIPTKLVDFAGGVNVTLGLPIIRTSVDHGTAHDIAGKGIANPESLIRAIELASQMALCKMVP
jgi:4-hydroxythreonine-4-phosphate dehydrogenase